MSLNTRINNTIDFYGLSGYDKKLVGRKNIEFQCGKSAESIAFNDFHFFPSNSSNRFL